MRKHKSHHSHSNNRTRKKMKPNKTDTIAEMLELRGFTSAVVKDTLERQKEKDQRKFISYTQA